MSGGRSKQYRLAREPEKIEGAKYQPLARQL